MRLFEYVSLLRVDQFPVIQQLIPCSFSREICLKVCEFCGFQCEQSAGTRSVIDIFPVNSLLAGNFAARNVAPILPRSRTNGIASRRGWFRDKPTADH